VLLPRANTVVASIRVAMSSFAVLSFGDSSHHGKAVGFMIIELLVDWQPHRIAMAKDQPVSKALVGR